LIVFFISPFFPMLSGLILPESAVESAGGIAGAMTKMIDKGAWGLIGNVTVFIIVSAFTQPPKPEKVSEMARLIGQSDK